MINRVELFALLLGMALLVACRPQATPQPTPFPTGVGVVAIPTPAGPISLTMTELSGAPGLYKDTRIQLTGRFQKQPILICDTETHNSPARWALVDEGITILAAGFNNQVRSLLPEGILVSAEGQWRQWQGLVGCGKQAQPKEVWYLDVSRILSPSPLAFVTLTPGGIPFTEEVTELDEVGATSSATPEEIAEVPTEPTELVGYPEPEITIESEQVEPVETPEELESSLPEPTPEEGQPFETPTPMFPTNEPGNQSTTTPDPLATPSTATTGTPSATPTVQPGNTPNAPIDQGNLNEALYEEFIALTLPANTIHKWEIDIYEGEEIKIMALAPIPADLVLSVIKDGQTVINRQNQAPAGVVETVTIQPNTSDGFYEILVQTQNGEAADYALLVNYREDFPNKFINGMISPDSPKNSVNLGQDEAHFWFFVAEAGQTITIRLVPNNDTDPVLDLFGPDAEYIDTIDSGYNNQEENYDLVISESGMYGIRVSEILYEPLIYSLSINPR